MKINWKQKLTSRKFWAAVAGFAASIALALGYSENTVSLVAGTVMAGASCIAYILGEGLVDAYRSSSGEGEDE